MIRNFYRIHECHWTEPGELAVRHGFVVPYRWHFILLVLGHAQRRLSEDGRGTCNVLELLFPFQVWLPEVAIQAAFPGEGTTGRRLVIPISTGGRFMPPACVSCPLVV